MKNRFTLLILATVCCTLCPLANAQDAATSEPDDALTPRAEAIVGELRSSFASDSEAIAMLEDILKGSNLGSEDGWFPLAKSQSRFDWEYVREKYDANDDLEVSMTEFSGSEDDFNRLDRNGDQSIAEADFDWSKHSLTPTPGFIMFFMADRDGNGKVTQEEFAALFEMLRGKESGFLAIDDLSDQFIPTQSTSSEKRVDRPSRSTLVEGLKNQEIGSLQSGPNVGDPAPDFTLESLKGNSVTLSSEVGDKPIVLIFGNFTCGPFRSQAGNIEKLVERYQDRAKFFLVYVREAHPSDGWWMTSNQRVGIDLSQPVDTRQRREVAMQCQKHLELDIPFLVDSVADEVGTTYSGMPNRLYLIDQQGQVVFKNGRGPFGFHPRQIEQALVLLLNDPSK